LYKHSGSSYNKTRHPLRGLAYARDWLYCDVFSLLLCFFCAPLYPAWAISISTIRDTKCIEVSLCSKLAKLEFSCSFHHANLLVASLDHFSSVENVSDKGNGQPSKTSLAAHGSLYVVTKGSFQVDIKIRTHYKALQLLVFLSRPVMLSVRPLTVAHSMLLAVMLALYGKTRSRHHRRSSFSGIGTRLVVSSTSLSSRSISEASPALYAFPTAIMMFFLLKVLFSLFASTLNFCSSVQVPARPKHSLSARSSGCVWRGSSLQSKHCLYPEPDLALEGTGHVAGQVLADLSKIYI
jgi:hypothetical protein